MPHLLSVHVQGHAVITLSGPLVHRHVGVISDTLESPHLNIATNADALIDYSLLDGPPVAWTHGLPGPRLYEDVTYELSVEVASTPDVPTIRHRHPGVVSNVRTYNGGRLVVAQLKFGRSIGRSTIEVAIGNFRAAVEVEIRPTKLDYATDFPILLSEVNGYARALALEYMRPSYIAGSTGDGERTRSLEWLVLARRYLSDLERAVHYIADHPHRVLERTPEVASVHRLRRTDPLVRRAVTRGLGSGEKIDVPGIGVMRSVLPSNGARDTLDTPEHRWIRHRLRIVSDRLQQIHAAISREVARSRARGSAVDRLLAEADEVSEMTRRVALLEGLAPFTAVQQRSPSLGPPSLTLLQRPGYRDTYKIVIDLARGLTLEGSDVEFSPQDLHQLYENWCFLTVAALIVDLAPPDRLSGSVVSVEDGTPRVRLTGGGTLKLNYAASAIELVFNPTITCPTGDQRPDIALVLTVARAAPVYVLFDAKYRLDSSDGYTKTYGSIGPPIDAVNELHRYRDAIVIADDRGRSYRPVVYGAALFPLPAGLQSQFASGRLYSSLSEIGIGALPASPGELHTLRTWLSAIVATPHSELLAKTSALP